MHRALKCFICPKDTKDEAGALVCESCAVKSVLEVGGGNAVHQHQGLRRLPHYLNLDRVPYDDRTVRTTLGVDPLPAKDDSVDFIYTSHCLEHVTELKYLLNECWRVLKETGSMEIVVPLFSSDKALAIDHVRVFSRETFKSLQYSDIRDYGFKPWLILYCEGEKDNAGNPEIRCRMAPDKTT